MNFFIRGNVVPTESIKTYLEVKLSKIEKYFNDGINANVHANMNTYENGRKQKIELTVKTLSGFTIRAEEVQEDLYASIDLVVDKLERQIRKHKTVVNRKSREKGLKEVDFKHIPEDSDFGVFDEDSSEFEIIKTKQIGFKPMDVEEAILQMNLLGHDFFVFNDAETSETKVVYVRKDGKYGLIES